MKLTISLPAISLVALILACSSHSEAHHTERGEHARDEEHGGEGEEKGTELSRDERYDSTRNGVRLVLAYDETSHSFRGTVENTTERVLELVRVEVHLSNGRELGPTRPEDLLPGAKREVTLVAESTDFERWTAHPEVGSEEHGHGEDDGEHDREGRGEHGREGRGEHDRDGEHR